jgi:hypothetical protein
LAQDEEAGNYELWDNKVGQGVGNFKSLDVLWIMLKNNEEGDNNEGCVFAPDWEILARILRHVSHDIKLDLGYACIQGIEETRAFPRAVRGHPVITRMNTRSSFHFESTDILCSALATLPNLQSVFLGHRALGREEVPNLGRPESMTELLRVPSLRSVEFHAFCFTNPMCEATANALKEGSVVTTLHLDNCSFPEGGGEKIVSALKRNATLTTFLISTDSINEAFCDAMAASLLSNSMLQYLDIGMQGVTTPAMYGYRLYSWLWE